MDLVEFSRKGGHAKSVAKTAANRRKMRAFWAEVRRGERPAPRRHRKFPEEVRTLAARYLWWQSAEESLARPRRVIAQVLDLGTMEDCALIERHFTRTELRAALRHAEPGWFRPRSWTYWHYRLGLTPWGGEVPEPPSRVLS